MLKAIFLHLAILALFGCASRSNVISYGDASGDPAIRLADDELRIDSSLSGLENMSGARITTNPDNSLSFEIMEGAGHSSRINQDDSEKAF